LCYGSVLTNKASWERAINSNQKYEFFPKYSNHTQIKTKWTNTCFSKQTRNNSRRTRVSSLVRSSTLKRKTRTATVNSTPPVPVDSLRLAG